MIYTNRNGGKGTLSLLNFFSNCKKFKWINLKIQENIKMKVTMMGGDMLNKSLLQFSVGGRGSVPSLLFDLRPNYDGGNEENGKGVDQG